MHFFCPFRKPFFSSPEKYPQAVNNLLRHEAVLRCSILSTSPYVLSHLHIQNMQTFLHARFLMSGETFPVSRCSADV
jgi:hypothetical protein